MPILSRVDVAGDTAGEWRVTTWQRVYTSRGIHVRASVCGHMCVRVCD